MPRVVGRDLYPVDSEAVPSRYVRVALGLIEEKLVQGQKHAALRSIESGKSWIKSTRSDAVIGALPNAEVRVTGTPKVTG